jgi:hypothetical protein
MPFSKLRSRIFTSPCAQSESLNNSSLHLLFKKKLFNFFQTQKYGQNLKKSNSKNVIENTLTPTGAKLERFVGLLLNEKT